MSLPAAPSGFQNVTCTSITPVGLTPGPLSLVTGQSPAVAVNDTFVVSLVTSPSGYAVHVNGDGTVVIADNGDRSRQSFQYAIYKVSGDTLTANGTVWIDEVAPVWPGNVGPFYGQVSTTFAVDLTTYCASPSGDVLTFALASGALPPGLSLSAADIVTQGNVPITTQGGALLALQAAGGVLSGLLGSVAGTYTFTISATDVTGTVSTSPVIVFNLLTVPNIIPPPPPPPPIVPGSLTGVVAPPQDTAGILLQAEIATVQLLVNANTNPTTLDQDVQLLNQLQISLVDHFMATGWLNAGTILAMYSLPPWNTMGVALLALIANTQALINKTPATSPVLANYKQLLYVQQSEAVDYMMALPGGTTAATLLSTMTGFQSFPFEYVFNSIGFTDQWIEG